MGWVCSIWEWITDHATVLSAVVSAIAACWVAAYTVLLRRSTSQLWSAATDQLNVMKGQLDEMRQSFAADRAYVLSAGFNGFGKPPSEGGTVTFLFKNFGKTPADIRMQAARGDYSSNGFIPFQATAHIPGFTDETGKQPVANTLDAGAALEPIVATIKATPEQIENARAGMGNIYCRAVIAYDDMRGMAHETASCWVYHFGLRAWVLCAEKGATHHD